MIILTIVYTKSKIPLSGQAAGCPANLPVACSSCNGQQCQLSGECEATADACSTTCDACNAPSNGGSCPGWGFPGATWHCDSNNNCACGYTCYACDGTSANGCGEWTTPYPCSVYGDGLQGIYATNTCDNRCPVYNGTSGGTTGTTGTTGGASSGGGVSVNDAGGSSSGGGTTGTTGGTTGTTGGTTGTTGTTGGTTGGGGSSTGGGSSAAGGSSSSGTNSSGSSSSNICIVPQNAVCSGGLPMQCCYSTDANGNQTMYYACSCLNNSSASTNSRPAESSASSRAASSASTRSAASASSASSGASHSATSNQSSSASSIRAFGNSSSAYSIADRCYVIVQPDPNCVPTPEVPLSCSAVLPADCCDPNCQGVGCGIGCSNSSANSSTSSCESASSGGSSAGFNVITNCGTDGSCAPAYCGDCSYVPLDIPGPGYYESCFTTANPACVPDYGNNTCTIGESFYVGCTPPVMCGSSQASVGSQGSNGSNGSQGSGSSQASVGSQSSANSSNKSGFSKSTQSSASSCAIGQSCYTGKCNLSISTPTDHPAGKPYLCDASIMKGVYGNNNLAQQCECVKETIETRQFVAAKNDCDSLCQDLSGGSSSGGSEGSNGSASSAASDHGGYCCIGGNFCSQEAGCGLPNCSTCNDHSAASNASDSSASSQTACPANACGEGGEEFCQANNQSCQNLTDLPCIKCVPLLNCQSDGDCPATEMCVNGQCRVQCKDNSECVSNQCVNGVCNCSGDSQCQDGLTCVNGQCRHPTSSSASSVGECRDGHDCPSGVCQNGSCTCDGNSQCPGNEQCVNGLCGGGSSSASSVWPCSSADQCPSGQQCIQGYCKKPSSSSSSAQFCQTDNDCPTGHQCIDNKCEQGQCSGNECAAGGTDYCQSIGKSCQNVSGLPCIRCIAPVECQSDSDCPSGQSCINGKCSGGGESSSAAIQSSSAANKCTGQECAQGGNAYCQSIGKTCQTISGLPCVQCVSAQTSSAPSLVGYCCMNGKVIQSASCTLTQDEASAACSGTHSSVGIIGYGSSSVGACTGTECDQGGTAFCATQNMTCASLPNAPCIQCVPNAQKCQNDLQCPSGLCQNGKCAACTADSQCSTNFCVNGKCSQCTTGSQCSTGLCTNGTCSLCSSDAQCAQGQKCLNGSCIRPICGNGTIEPGEECDDGSTRNGHDGICDSSCHRLTGTCGDGIVESLLGEQCEPALPSPVAGVTCNGHCRLNLLFCGNGKIDPGEQCDEGTKNSNAPGAHCRTDCSLPRCGDGVVDPGEQCDDGNTVDGDGCSSKCMIEKNAAGTQVLPANVLQLPFSPAPGNMLCTSDAQCASGQRCLNGQCSCTSSTQCQAGTQCINGLCSNTLCTSNAQCAIGEACQSGKCVLGVQYGQQSHAPVGKTGPATLAIMAAGASAGYAFMRRKKR